jgi:hypothetical protein
VRLGKLVFGRNGIEPWTKSSGADQPRRLPAAALYVAATHSPDRLTHQTSRAANIVEQVGKAQRPELSDFWGSGAAFIEQAAELELQLDWVKSG